MYTIQTQRLGLRNWRPSDFELFAEMNADEEVMEFFPKTLLREESAASYDRLVAHFDKYGFTYFATETLVDQQFIGFIGLMHQTYESPFTYWMAIAESGMGKRLCDRRGIGLPEFCF